MENVLLRPPVASHSPEGLARLFEQQRNFFASGVTLSEGFRRGQLRVLRAAVKKHEDEIIGALRTDLHKSLFESYGSEIGPFYKELSLIEKNLRQWMAPRRVETPLMFFPSTSRVMMQPLGVTLIMTPWNYPFLLMLQALANSMAAGNTVILKPSEEAKASEAVMQKIIASCFEPDYVAVTTGPGQYISEHLIQKHHLDMVFFTGSTAVGQKIMQAAAGQLTPVILELGGKSPCIVAKDAPIDYAAKKILFSSFFNAGQTCVACDYILVHQSVKEPLIKALKKYLLQFYGPDAQQSNDYGRIINQKHFTRLLSYLQQGKVIVGGRHSQEALYIEPTLMEDVSMDDPVMRDEIFGPIKPILTYNSQEEAIHIIEQRPYPLALYVYTRSRQTANYFLQRVRFGGGCVNNGIIHLGNSHLPFAGVGYSGIGGYHGEYGFRAFSHTKSLLWSSPWFDLPVWYPPYKPVFLRVLKKLMK